MDLVFQCKSINVNAKGDSFNSCTLYDINGKEIGFLGMYSSDNSYWTIQARYQS